MFCKLQIWGSRDATFNARVIGVSSYDALPFGDDNETGVESWGLDFELENGQRIFADAGYNYVLEEIEKLIGKKINFELEPHFGSWVEIEARHEKYVTQSEQYPGAYYISGLILDRKNGFELDCGLPSSLPIRLPPSYGRLKSGIYIKIGDPSWWKPSACSFQAGHIRVVDG